MVSFKNGHGRMGCFSCEESCNWRFPQAGSFLKEKSDCKYKISHPNKNKLSTVKLEVLCYINLIMALCHYVFSVARMVCLHWPLSYIIIQSQPNSVNQLCECLAPIQINPNKNTLSLFSLQGCGEQCSDPLAWLNPFLSCSTDFVDFVLLLCITYSGSSSLTRFI